MCSPQCGNHLKLVSQKTQLMCKWVSALSCSIPKSIKKKIKSYVFDTSLWVEIILIIGALTAISEHTES